jgi:signal transduction histidine kinase
MSITAKSAFALLAIFLALLGGAWIALEAAVRPSFERQEAAANERDLTRLQENLRAVGRDLVSRTTDYAHWDDTYDYVAGQSPGYIEENFSDEWFTSYGVDFVAFADTHGRLLWTRGRRPQQAPAADPQLARGIMAQARGRGVPADGAAQGIFWTPDGPLLFAASPANRSENTAEPRGMVVIGRLLNAEALQHQLQLELRFLAPNGASALAGRMRALADRESVSWADAKTRYALIGLRDGEDLGGAVLATQRREISALGAQTIASAIALLAVLFACIFGVLWFVLKHLVTSRLSRIKAHFETQDMHAEPLPSDPSTDEIGQLTGAYNTLLAGLRSALENEQRAQREREIATAESRVKSDFLANISHELRTPLNAVMGYAELIAEELDEQGVATGRADLEHITGAARRLLTLINEINDLSRIEGGRLDLRPEAFRVDEMLRSVVEAATPLANAQDNVLRLEFEGDLDIAYNDHVRLRQCLVSVLESACQRTRGGVVKLRVERHPIAQGDVLRFEVSDNGPSLSSAEIDALFEPFVRPGQLRGGAQLGLAVTRKLLTLMGGRIDVTNKTDRGCLFAVSAPTQLTEAPSAGQAAA